jgi:hypothetical protein
MSKRIKMTVRPSSSDQPLGIKAVGRWWNGDAIHLSGPAVIRAEIVQAGPKRMTNVFIELPNGTLINVSSGETKSGPFTVADLRSRLAGLPGDMLIDAAGAEAVLSILQSDTSERLAEARPAGPYERPKNKPTRAHDTGDEDDGGE